MFRWEAHKFMQGNQNKISTDIDETISTINTIFENCDDIVKKSFELERSDGFAKIFIVYVDGLTNNEMVEETLIKPLSFEWRESSRNNLFEDILSMQAQTVDIKAESELESVITSVLKGDTALFVDNSSKAMVISTKKFPLRGITSNELEGGLRGPRDSFTEGFRQSTALIRRRIRDPKLKVCQGLVGSRSRTDYGIIYMEDIAKPELVETVKAKIEECETDGIFDSGMLEHLMENDWNSVFPMLQSTTRPDKVASSVMEGRVAIVVDNSPEVLLAPVGINTLFQTSDDYYNSWITGTFGRILRYLAAWLAISMPGIYIAFTTFHSELIPDRLLYAIVSSRSIVTFPIVVEVIVMELLFELLREAGIRLPGPLGNTIGVVGGLIVGQAAVEAGLVSTIVVIVVALGAIASFAIPNQEFATTFRLTKFLVIAGAALLGLLGLVVSQLFIVVHLTGLDSFGYPYMMPATAGKGAGAKKDFIVRSPISKMLGRPPWGRGMKMKEKEGKDIVSGK